MQTITGNILDVVTERGGILVHQVNCQRKAGAGLALQIQTRWPTWYQAFVRVAPSLGRTHLFDVMYWDKPQCVTIASLYAQWYYGRNEAQTSIDAFEQCLASLWRQAGDRRIFFPMGIGCGLAGGNWNVIYPMIAKTFPNATLVQFKK